MNSLNEEQMVFVEKILNESQLTYAPLKEELFDHICCVVEAEMAKGKPFEMAMVHARFHFGKENLNHIQKDTIHQLTYKQKLMKRISVIAGALTVGLFIIAVTAIAQNTPELFPIENGTINSKATYGARNLKVDGKVVKKFHKGIDIVAPTGTPIYASADGIVEKADSEDVEKKGYGNNIIIKHDETYKTRYAHLSEMKVKAGAKVNKGDIIGYSGNTGLSTGPHLHYEVIKDGENVDPQKFFTKK
ncbi:MAG: M23 family metallopeptidase [Bacteroidetes bacterium]|nr:M23 family metallopeptidase [Bacteroidota bacterium]MCB0846236.1 M23 family metallopeptidase [Bacteroidota bacterium]